MKFCKHFDIGTISIGIVCINFGKFIRVMALDTCQNFITKNESMEFGHFCISIDIDRLYACYASIR